MVLKRIICPDRLRRIPAHFSWLDHRLVREHYIEQCDVHAGMLYLFLVTVADAQGLSWYSDASMARRLSMDSLVLCRARGSLMRAGLIAWDRPLYQVLALDAPHKIPVVAAAPVEVPEVVSPEAGRDEIRARIAALRAAVVVRP